MASRAGVRALLAGAAALATVTPAPAEAQTPTSFPTPQGPALGVDGATLEGSLHCPAQFTHPARGPVLLVHGTGTNDGESWSWNYALVLPGLGFDVCTVTLPGRALDDAQVSSEYVVYAIRAMARRSGRRVEVIGHSQGGLEPRWALKWWPDTRVLVDDLITLAATHHGTLVADAVTSALGQCTGACWQQRTDSKFIAALNAGGETFPEVSSTAIYSLTDELVQPQTPPRPTSSLDGPPSTTTNVAVQDLCPGRPVDHLAILGDAVAFSMVMDAMTHPGPADPKRFDPATCAKGTFDGVDATRLAQEPPPDFGQAGMLRAEPPLRPYAQSPSGQAGSSGVTATTATAGPPAPATGPTVPVRVAGARVSGGAAGGPGAPTPATGGTTAGAGTAGLGLVGLAAILRRRATISATIRGRTTG